MTKILYPMSVVLCLLLFAFALAGCELQLQPLPSDGNQEVAQMEPTEAPAEEPVVEPNEEPAEEPTEEPTPIPATSTPVPTPTSVPPTATAISAPADPIVTISTASLRIRSGPSTEYAILGSAGQGESFVITGQAFDCGWYQITHPQYGTAWTSGSSDFVTSNGADCAQIPLVDAPPLPTPAPQPTAAPADQGGGQSGREQSAGNQGGDSELPSDKGCYLFQNQLGPELNVTITNANDGSSIDNFQVGPSEEKPYCLWPGKYNVTVDAPPPWADINDTINVSAGQHFFFPIRAR